MMKPLHIFLLVAILVPFSQASAQPFVDIANFNYQNFTGTNKSNPAIDNTTEVYSLSVFLPKELKSGNALLFRINGESIQSSTSPRIAQATSVFSISVALGYQWLSESKKWKSVLMGIPKVASDFKSSVDNHDFQYGMLFVQNYKWNPNLQLKAGLYYNKEAFGNFFVPLVGVDWKASDRWQLFGLLPTNYKIEYAIAKKKWYTGVNFKAFTRSFHLSPEQNNDYIRFDEVVLKGFLEYYCTANIVAYAEIGQSFGKSLLQYKVDSDDLSYSNPNYTPISNYVPFTIGLVYRIRTE